MRLGALALAFTVVSASSCSQHGTPRPETIAEERDGTPITDPWFEVQPTTVRLPRLCRVSKMIRDFKGLVGAFDRGEARRFAAFFTPDAPFNPYAGTSRRRQPLRGRREIAEFASQRHARGDRWTLVFVSPPKGRVGLPKVAVYGLGLRVSQDGRIVSEGGAKAVIDCRSGLIMGWVGPRVGPR